MHTQQVKKSLPLTTGNVNILVWFHDNQIKTTYWCGWLHFGHMLAE